MKEQINLLPAPIQRARLRNLYGLRVRHVLGAIIIALAIVLATQLVSLTVLKAIYKDVGGEIGTLSDQEKNMEEHTKEANDLLRELDLRISNYELWSPQVESVLKLVSPNLRIVSMSVDSGKPALEIKATSASRAAGVDFQKALEGLPWVESVEAPLQNFASSSSGAFTFTLFRAKQK